MKGMTDYLGCSLAQPALRALEREMIAPLESIYG